MTSQHVRVGIIGCGKVAQFHAAALQQLDEADFVAVCDADVIRAQAMADAFGVPNVFSDVDAMLASGLLDAVTVCVPHQLHEQVVVAAARSGVAILCEKPLAVSMDEADRMIAACDAAGVALGVIFQRRFWPSAQRIRQAIDDGKLGRMTMGDVRVQLWRPEAYYRSDPWRGTWANEGGGVLMTQAVHAIDLLVWYMGKPVEVFGRYATLRHGDYIEVEDTVAATVVFENGALGVIHAVTTHTVQTGYRVEVHGTSGAVVSVWEEVEGEQGINDVWRIPGEERLREEWASAEAGLPGFPGFHTLQIREFLEAVREGREPAVSGRDGRVSLAVIQAIYESSRTGLPVRL